MSIDKKTMNLEEIKSFIPHRYPFLLIDKVISYQEKQIKAIKNVTVNEPFFQGHFPHEAIMPGVLQIEAMAQTAGVLIMKNLGLDSSYSIYFVTIDNVKFRHPAKPGDQLVIQIDVNRYTQTRAAFEGKIHIEEKLICEAKMTAIINKK